MSNVFLGVDQWAGATENIRRCLSHIKQDTPWFNKLLEVAIATKIKHKAPYWEPTAWAHVGFPSLKMAVICVSTLDSTRDVGLREQWERIGWKCLLVKKQDLGADTQALAEQLLAAVKMMGKKR
jgi:hypothetical protein